MGIKSPPIPFKPLQTEQALMSATDPRHVLRLMLDVETDRESSSGGGRSKIKVLLKSQNHNAITLKTGLPFSFYKIQKNKLPQKII
jgi:hypothetical protein